ncbi:MAG: hypothetical protein LQ340_003396 [Diploschistes diacapsis]|nr:MAG: hypothetical protein LQ340_003396 [Diploschistes diacapsis]
MLLANLSKSDSLSRLFAVRRSCPKPLCTSPHALSQLLDLYAKGSTGSYNPRADFAYLAYVFADLAKHGEGAMYFTTRQPYDSLHPISKLLPFASHASPVRRLGAVSTLKNISFSTSAHSVLLSPPLSALPYVLLPLASGADNYSDAEEAQLPDELQLLDASVKREQDVGILRVLLETLLLWTTERRWREELREKGVYYVVRECHLGVVDEVVREDCERLVNVLMRDEEGEEQDRGRRAEVVGRAEGIEGGGGPAGEGRMIIGSSGGERRKVEEEEKR